MTEIAQRYFHCVLSSENRNHKIKVHRRKNEKERKQKELIKRHVFYQLKRLAR